MVNELYRCGFNELIDTEGYKKAFFKKGVYYNHDVGGYIDYEIYVCFTGRSWYIIDKIKRIKIENIEDLLERYPFLPIYDDNFVFIYFIRQENTDFFKIGKTKNMNDRLNFFGVKLPFKWSVYKVFLVSKDKLSEIETAIHEVFAEYKVNGEWFKLDSEALQRVEKSHKNFYPLFYKS
jgi:hypothetical protein